MEPTTKTPIANDASKGLVTSRDSSTLLPGELSEAVACEYHIGSPHLYKLPGRSSNSQTLGAPVLAITKLQYDSGTDVLIADANGNIKESSVSLTPSFTTTAVTELSTTAIPQYTGYNNAWIRCNGIDNNLIRELGVVPNGTQGNWRNVGMLPAGVPTVSNFSNYAGGGKTLRPTGFTQGVENIFPSTQEYYDQNVYASATCGFNAASLAIDGPGTGTGTVSGAANQQILTGDSFSTAFIAQLSIGAILTFNDGTQNTVISIASDYSLTLENNILTALVGATFVYTNATTSTAPEETAAIGTTTQCQHRYNNRDVAPRTAYCTWNFTTNLAYPGRSLYVMHNSSCSPPDWSSLFGPTGMEFKIEYSINGGAFTTLGQVRNQPYQQVRIDSIPIPDGIDISGGATPANNLKIKATVISRISHRHDGTWLEAALGVYDIKVSTGASGAYNASNPIYYGVTEIYKDSDGIEHQGNMGVTNAQPLKIEVADLQNVTSVVLTLPAKVNPLATNFIVWRSVDTPGGGYPVMYRVGNPNITEATWTDTFTIRPDDTAAIGLLDQYTILEILYSTGESLLASFYSQPPLSFMTLPFQGCLCYFPSGLTNARKVFYSLPATVSKSALEQVPELYYLDFQTPRNDQVRSGAVTNGGRSMLVFFENYTMLVNYLPQGADPGGFNNSVKEFVTNIRGCAGKKACTEFTLASGQVLVASVDSLGLWITNGVNLIEEWSTDLDWDSAFEGVDLSTIDLVDKPHKRRLELLFTTSDNLQKEYHFFYGHMKQSQNGKNVPLITGPHPSGIRCKHYTTVDSRWAGFSGDATNTGNVFTEDVADADASHGYDNTGIVPWSWTLGDMYVGGIHKAQIVESANIKFADSPVKDFQIVGTFTRDSGTIENISKVITGDHNSFPKQIYWHQYCDRHKIGFTDLTNTASPAFISYVLKTRSAGGARDK